MAFAVALALVFRFNIVAGRASLIQQTEVAAAKSQISHKRLANLSWNSLLQLQEDVIKMNRSGQDPQGIQHHIQNSLLPQAGDTKAAMQGEVDNVENHVKQCHGILDTAEMDLQQKEKILTASEQENANEKNELLMKNKTSASICSDKDNYAQNLKGPAPITPEILNKSTTTIETALRAHTAFYNEAYPRFMEKKEACNNAAIEVASMKAGLRSKRATLETMYCETKKAAADSCVAYGHCFEERVKKYRHVISHVKALEKHTKETFQSLTCFGGDNLDASYDEADCDENAVDTSHLDITYPFDPEQGECLEERRTTEDYSSVGCADMQDPNAVASNANAGGGATQGNDADLISPTADPGSMDAP